MKVEGIGINLHPDRVQGELERMRRELEFFQGVGYEYVEVPVDAVDVVYRGVLRPQRMRRLRAILRDFDLKYTVHAPLALDLRSGEDLEVQRDLFRASLDFTSEIGATVFVYHYGRKSPDPGAEERLREEMERAARYAARSGIRICVENIEIDHIRNVLEFVRDIGCESVGMTLDLGHAFLAAHRFGFDFLEAVRLAEPLVKHIHLSDNFGRFEEARLTGYERYKAIPYRRLVSLGKGDLHLPPGWGEVPLREALALLEGYEGVVILEYYSHRYREEADEILREARAILGCGA